MEENQSGGIIAWMKAHAVIAAVFIGLVIGAVVLMFKQQPGGAASTAATGNLSGLATNANGQPVVYVPVQNTYENIYAPTTTNPPPPPPPPNNGSGYDPGGNGDPGQDGPPPPSNASGSSGSNNANNWPNQQPNSGGFLSGNPIIGGTIPMGDGGDPSAPPFGPHMAALSPQPPQLLPGDPTSRGMWTGAYMTMPGDSLESIAHNTSAHGVQTSWIDLYAHNRANLHAVHGNVIRPHQQLASGVVLSVPRT